MKRGLLSWTLACIGDEKSADFVRKELLEKLENMKAFWGEPMKMFWGAVADMCDGDDEKLMGIEIGIRRIAEFAQPEPLMDEARNGREDAGFKPKGDNLFGDGED